jgi:uncharacterized protein involved in cysteine biosynthesis
MIFADFASALRQMTDPRFLRVMVLGVALALALLVAVYAGFLGLIEAFSPGSVDIPFIGPVGGIDTLLSWGSFLLMIGLSVFLMVPVASAFSGLFLEDVAAAVEARHYPDLPPVPPLPLGESLKDAVNFLGLLIAVNVVALFFYALAGPFVPLAFWALNGLLLGREYFSLVAMRRYGRPAAKALRRRYFFRIWAAGALMAAPLSIPFVNLLIPVLGVATFTHMVQRLAR